MTLNLELSPAEEQELRATAAREGVSPTVLAYRLFVRGLKQQRNAETAPVEAWQAPAPDHSAEAQRAAIHALLTLPKEEIALFNAPSIARLEAQLAAAAKATPEEVAQANVEWEEHKRRMNAHRAVTGERPLYVDVVPADA